MQLSPEITQYIKDLTDGLYSGYTLKLEEVAKKLGLKCYLADFPDDRLSGAIIKDEESDSYNIYVNENHHPNRRRFTIAHEIGHYISYMHNSYSRDELLSSGGFEDFAMSLRQDGNYSDAETEANLIAAELLMPEEKVRELVEKNLMVEEMADLFFVSPSAMTIRLQSLYGSVMIV